MSVRERLFMAMVRQLPRRRLSRMVGWAADRRVPTALRRPLYAGFAEAVGAELADTAGELESFERFNAFFSRALAPRARPWQVRTSDWAMPADGTLSVRGRVQRGQILQVKGIDYGVGALLGEDERAWEGARYATIYLSPADYHRVHWPTDARLKRVRSMGGDLWPVNPTSVRSVPQLFVENERTVSIFTDAAGRRGAIVMVGATIVGGIALRNAQPHTGESVGVAAGDEHGTFYFGSTVVVLVCDQDAPLAGDDARVGAPVQVGQPLWWEGETPSVGGHT